MASKILFFDIDGTLLEHDAVISDDTCEALQKAHKSGHKLCIASGRSKGNLPAGLDRISWDGYVLANGIYGEYQNKVVFSERLEPKLVLQFLNYIENLPQFEVVLENNSGSYVTHMGMEMLRKKIKQSGLFNIIGVETVLDEFTVIEDLREIPEVNKIMYFSEGDLAETVIERFKAAYDFLPNSVIPGNDMQDGEIMKKGVTKARGIAKLLPYAGYQQEDVIAFGDGHNDIEMIQKAGIGVAMGNSVEALKQVADIVTGTQAENGISKAMTLLKLI